MIWLVALTYCALIVGIIAIRFSPHEDREPPWPSDTGTKTDGNA